MPEQMPDPHQQPAEGKRSGNRDAIRHDLAMEVQDEPRMFRAVCSCGRYTGKWETTNACMGGGHRHVSAMRRYATPPGQPRADREATR